MNDHGDYDYDDDDANNDNDNDDDDDDDVDDDNDDDDDDDDDGGGGGEAYDYNDIVMIILITVIVVVFMMIPEFFFTLAVDQFKDRRVTVIEKAIQFPMESFTSVSCPLAQLQLMSVLAHRVGGKVDVLDM
ncbi:hypothetical protein ElyMa_002201900 [Elysia marginata]|uniref:Uncharacterized protein n=1 Tax=Elysia marginata TaxID=1093978 RepID=A0AAV4FTC0_9GAST|nr:hypothetical protein ElyMa_002201900 [Elysia marginata]